MSPILGIYASQISGHLWEPAGGYDALWSTTLAASTSSITISGIPSTYKHLQIRFIALGSASYRLAAQFNSDTATNYSWHALEGGGASAGSGAGTTASSMKVGETIATYPSVGVIDILDYKDTNKYKTIKVLEGFDANGSGYVQFFSGSWRSTAAITSITLGTLISGSMNQYSSFALYGIK
jgi:hypothetical protein